MSLWRLFLRPPVACDVRRCAGVVKGLARRVEWYQLQFLCRLNKRDFELFTSFYDCLSDSWPPFTSFCDCFVQPVLRKKIGVNFHVIPYNISSFVILHTSDRRRRRVSGDTLASLVIASVDARRWDCL